MKKSNTWLIFKNLFKVFNPLSVVWHKLFNHGQLQLNAVNYDITHCITYYPLSTTMVLEVSLVGLLRHISIV